MNQYVTGAAIRAAREARGLTQSALAERLCVSDKAVSKWETGRGYPDITLLAPLAQALGISVPELLSGSVIRNTNIGAGLHRSCLYVCPVCGNVLFSVGQAAVSCHGVELRPLEAEQPDEAHTARITPVEDEYFIEFDHPMTKTHYISFIAAVTDSAFSIVKLYPEGPAQTRVRRGFRQLYAYCNRDGLFRITPLPSSASRPRARAENG